MDRTLAALPRADARIGNIDRLTAIARRHDGTLTTFVRWLERHIREEVDEAEAAVFSAEDDAVRLTTIHASKGLSFPVVILVDLNAQPRGDYPSLGFLPQSASSRATLVVRHYAPREEGATPVQTAPISAAHADAVARDRAERKRLSYVGMTRAERLLVLVGASQDPRPGLAFATLSAGMAQGDLATVVTTRVPAVALLREPAPKDVPVSTPAPQVSAPPRPTHVPVSQVSVPARALALFAQCPRRYQFRCLLGFEERSPHGEADREPFEAFGDDVLPPRTTDGDSDAVRWHSAPHRVLQRRPRSAWGTPTDSASRCRTPYRRGISERVPRLVRPCPWAFGILGQRLRAPDVRGPGKDSDGRALRSQPRPTHRIHR